MNRPLLKLETLTNVKNLHIVDFRNISIKWLDNWPPCQKITNFRPRNIQQDRNEIIPKCFFFIKFFFFSNFYVLYQFAFFKS